MIKDIPGYEGMYAVDDIGDVFSYKFGKVKKMKASLNSHGYLMVKLCKDGKQENCNIHRLMAKIFLSNYSEDLQVDHIDRDRTNNKLSNLRMATGQENMFNRGAKGYTWNKDSAKWKAYIRKDKKLKHLGYFDKEEEARAAYLEAKKIYHII